MKILTFISLISAVAAFDVIREAFRKVDDSKDPCDNFYRHACPIGSDRDLLIETAYADLFFRIKAKSVDAIWNNLEIEKTLMRTPSRELTSTNNFIGELFLAQCEDTHVKHEELLHFLKQIEHYVFKFDGSNCEYEGCLSALASDHNCTRASEKLKTTVVIDFLFLNLSEFWEKKFRIAKYGLDGVNALLDGESKQGVSKVNHLIERMQKKLISWVNETEWAINNGADEAIIEETLQVHHYDNYADSMRKNLQFLMKLEQDYLKCLRDTKREHDFETFCMLMSIFASFENEPDLTFFTFYNAFNAHPKLSFSQLFYDMAENVGESAGVLGSVGFIAGHELSHTLIENANAPQLIPYFSNESMQCIQNQYQKTCDHFVEESCGSADNQIDENGSDMLGLQLAYSLFEEEYQGRMDEEYIRIQNLEEYRSITMEQLFFYSTAFVACSGRSQKQRLGDGHSPWNVRVNAIVQHPGFKKAFNCPANSTMVESFDDQCIIFGKGAPEMRR
ncbi:hypothetical protein L5515_018136 [Caenorhabditis briggsae]|uniref:Peptidase M13 C-terminal domain-containing protein n=2 Tax=Caenorhabditis briggsae TaxID=6238 RepID=A0AAE9FIL1_CAEBR|nr:hypothetical protein L5515_018136 [Caenorhabditis briggsae]